MTNTDATSSTPQPWSLDLLADLHAGVLDEAEAAELRQRVQDDPEAMEIMASLDATSADLAEFAQQPAPPIPADVAERIDAALEEEAQRNQTTPQESGVAPVVSIDAARRKRNQRLKWGTGLLTAAAAVVAAVAIVVPSVNTTGGSPVAESPTTTQQQPGSAPLALTSDEKVEVGDLKGHQPGSTTERLAMISCLKSAKVVDKYDDLAKISIVGVRKGSFDGEKASIALLATKKQASYRVVVVPDPCGTANAEVLHTDVIG